MAISRYNELDIIKNDDTDFKQAYPEKFRDRQEISHFESQELSYPTKKEIKNFSFINHIWEPGDRFFKLAHVYYGDAKYWWVIAQFNKKPTEQHAKLGELIKVPLPIEEVLDSYGL